MLVVFSPTFITDTKRIFRYNFGALTYPKTLYRLNNVFTDCYLQKNAREVYISRIWRKLLI